MIFTKQKLIALCRKSLIGLDLDTKEYEEMIKADQVNFNQELTKVFYNKSFQKLMDILEKRQVIWIARDSKDETQKNFGRATINAIDYIKDKIEKYSALYQSKLSEGESFDPNKIV